MRESVTKNVMWNGKDVGTIQSRGDDEADTVAAAELLRQLGLYREASKADRMFSQAAAFTASAWLLFEKMNGDKTVLARYGAPFVVNMAFSVELYLKALSEAYGQNLRGHDLSALYDALPNVAKSLLESIAPEGRKQFPVAGDLTFKAVLHRTKDSFVEWRYNYEKDTPTAIFPIPEILFVSFSLHTACVRSGKLTIEAA